jgi:hypothetical protein
VVCHVVFVSTMFSSGIRIEVSIPLAAARAVSEAVAAVTWRRGEADSIKNDSIGTECKRKPRQIPNQFFYSCAQ